MPFSKVLSSAVFALILGGSGAVAQGLGGSGIPAEFPPTSYKSKQYVDSRGCVFIRAGVDGNVTWVPRVTRSRQPICGAQPTFAKAAPKPAPKPAAKPAPKPKVAQAPKPAPKKVVRAKPVPQRVVRATAPVPIAPKPVIVKAPAPKRVAPARIEAPKMASACTNFGASGKYMTGSGLRCGPQAESPVSFNDGSSGVVAAAPVLKPAKVRTPAVVSPRAVAPQTRIVPKHVYASQVEAKQGVHLPTGYRHVWTDDRLNPRRAQQTAAGKAQMDLVWTKTVPRKLIDPRSGKDMTRFHPNVVYPYTNLAQQQRADAFAHIKKTPVVASKGTTRKAVKPRAVVSSKSAPATKPVRASGKKYVQVGTFGVPANAQRTAARLQNSGLPVRIGRYSKGGKQYQIVMAGPFGSAQQLGAALSAARRAGFRDAFLR
ncbi:MAG: SPOR domain-containing protein [Thalassovita sp.]